MARKPRGQPSRGARSTATSQPPSDAIVDAMMRLLAARDFAGIGLAEIAEEAGVSLGALREAFPGKLSILAAFSRRIDRIVLDGGAGEGDTPRDRVFDVLMRRFDALAPYKDSIRSIARAARFDLCLAAFLSRNATRSMRWMLVAARADRPGMLGAIAVNGLVLVHGEGLRVWLDDDDPGLARTMATLDRGLERGARAMDVVEGICSRLRPFAAHGRAARPSAAKAET
jgi:AcrR family transcriptional regulator